MRLLIMGAPGAGKGTYAKGIAKHFGIPHISTGEMFRKAMSANTTMGQLARSYIDQGQLVPDEVTIAIVKDRIKEEDCKKGFILDGFPRTLEQAKSLTHILASAHLKLDVVINLFVDNDLIIRRITNRRLCSNCGKGYNLITIKPRVPGICDDCGAPLYQRKDDNVETITKRLSVYDIQTKPLIEYYEHLGNIMHINGAGEIDDVIEIIISKLEAR